MQHCVNAELALVLKGDGELIVVDIFDKPLQGTNTLSYSQAKAGNALDWLSSKIVPLSLIELCQNV